MDGREIGGKGRSGQVGAVIEVDLGIFGPAVANSRGLLHFVTPHGDRIGAFDGGLGPNEFLVGTGNGKSF